MQRGHDPPVGHRRRGVPGCAGANLPMVANCAVGYDTVDVDLPAAAGVSSPAPRRPRRGHRRPRLRASPRHITIRRGARCARAASGTGDTTSSSASTPAAVPRSASWGLGRIGLAVTHRPQTFGMRVVQPVSRRCRRCVPESHEDTITACAQATAHRRTGCISTPRTHFLFRRWCGRAASRTVRSPA
jgi:hypothetical protein